MSSNTSKKSLNAEEEIQTQAISNKQNRTVYLNNQLNMKRSSSIRTQLTNDLIEQNRNFKRLKEEQNLKNAIKKSNLNVFL